MPAKERELADWPSQPSSSSAPALPASPLRSSWPSAASASRWSSAAARWARAAARGWRAACWRRGASAPPPSPRSPTLGRAGDRLVGRALPRHGAQRQPGGRPAARRCPTSRALPSAPSASNGWTPMRIAALEPDLAGRFRRALFFPDEAHLDPRRALAALAEAPAATAASRSASASSWRRRTPDADIVVDCRGLAARDALPDLRGVRGEMVVVRSPEVSLSRPVRMLHPRIPLYIVPRGDGLFMIGATMIESERRGAGQRALGRRAAERRLCAASGLRRGRDRRAGRRPAAGLSRQPAGTCGEAAACCTSTACSVTASCWRPRWRGAAAEAVQSMLQPETNHADLPQRRRA